MLISAKGLNDYKLDSLEGPIGSVKQFYFEDRYWTIRYLVAETGHWLANKQVLISPRSLKDVFIGERYLSVSLTKQQIEDSPVLDSEKPVSRQFEEAYYGYYGWPSPYIWGAYPYLPAPFVFGNRGQTPDVGPGAKAWDAHLRSTHAVTGHHVQATDGEIGHIVDFIIDDQVWAIRYLVIDTLNWWPGKHVLIAPEWVESIDWEELKVFVNLTRDQVRQAPRYIDASTITPEYESQLRRHYNQDDQWIVRPAQTSQSQILLF